MKLMTARQERQLRENGRINSERTSEGAPTIDFKPVVKLFCPWNASTWLISEIDPNEPSIAIGLCDLGAGQPELGSASLDELASLVGPCGLRIERDRQFRGSKSLTAYAKEAQSAGFIRA